MNILLSKLYDYLNNRIEKLKLEIKWVEKKKRRIEYKRKLNNKTK